MQTRTLSGAPTTSPLPATSTTSDGGATTSRPDPRRAFAGALLAGFGLMAVGAVVGELTGVSFESASQDGTVPQVLGDVADGTLLLNVRYALWLSGMLAFSTAARMVRRLRLAPAVVDLASGSMALGAALAAVSYGLFLAVVNATGAGSPDIAATLAWAAVHVDWVATILILGISVPALVLFGGAEASPALHVLAWLSVAASLLTAISMAVGSGLATWGFSLVPVGMVLVAAYAISLRRTA